MNMELTPIDVKIWTEELDNFVPSMLYDTHAHVYKWSHAKDHEKEPMNWRKMYDEYPVGSVEMLNKVDELLFPGRKVHRIAAGKPFLSCDFMKCNEYTLESMRPDPNSGAILIVHPDMPEEYLEKCLGEKGFIGVKPYRFYSQSGDFTNCRIRDYLPERLLKVVDRYGSMIMLHVAKQYGLSDEDNVSDLETLTGRFPNIQWNLCHCGRTYIPGLLRKQKDRLGKIVNLWSDMSSVCDAGAIMDIISILGSDRVMYGSDDLMVGARKGKYIIYGYAWVELNESNNPFHPEHCLADMTFIRYETLRALKQASQNLQLNEEEINGLFYTNAKSLFDKVK